MKHVEWKAKLKIHLVRAHEAAAKATQNSNMDWRLEAFRSLMSTAIKKRKFQVDDVWDTFEVRGSGLSTHRSCAIGGLFLAAKNMGFIRPLPRPKEVVTLANHNNRGTAYWESLIHRPRVKDADRVVDALVGQVRTEQVLPKQQYFGFA